MSNFFQVRVLFLLRDPNYQFRDTALFLWHPKLLRRDALNIRYRGNTTTHPAWKLRTYHSIPFQRTATVSCSSG